MADDTSPKDNVLKNQKEGSKKGGSLKKVIMIWVPLFLVQLALSYVIVVKVFKRQAIQQEVEADGVKKQKKRKPGQIYLIEDVIVNPKGTMGRHFVNVSIGLEEGNKKLEKELKAQNAQVRDALIEIFVSKTIQELADVSSKESLKKEIMRRLNLMFGKGSIRHVYFSNFIIQ
ncbi:flagellar basal body-associated protein FliL [bacterium BMS3Abin05]|nr:flagellar basal body-associated protein FliL [bacterium BMS3Abin05]GBE28830.1 flagellar basal body-associated protein FliL [bacterium BMS3Bbin03]HDZ10570.1 hypothetical protein [Bacteroidota bacterium]